MSRFYTFLIGLLIGGAGMAYAHTIESNPCPDVERVSYVLDCRGDKSQDAAPPTGDLAQSLLEMFGTD